MILNLNTNPTSLRYANAQKSISKAWKSYQPKCASKNPKAAMPKNLEKAYESMLTIQEDFIEQREKIRSQLNTLSKYKETLSTIETPEPKRRSLMQILSPRNAIRRFSIQKIQRKSPSEKNSIIKLEKGRDIDFVMKNCEDFIEKNRNLSRDLPALQKFVSKSFKKIQKALNTVSRDGYSGEISYKCFNKRLVKGFYDVPKRFTEL
ncbi:hypothetical protein SteCoe_4793 [Stentor coeruleus]|uniref:Uncharacterized protein n=1 Tax=Stentor coeruleus TaxID=5963 RepID=A0A1R2CTW5_9CILI|nr:hypothetical protein SteCoe_4793 [Stentor coeruleus]